MASTKKSKSSTSKSAKQPSSKHSTHADAATDDESDDEPSTHTGIKNPISELIDQGLLGDADLSDLLDVGEFIRNQRENAKLSVRRLAELANVSNPYLSQIERGLRKPSAEILQQVANALRISVEQLYIRAGILPEDAHSVSSVPEAIEHDQHLSADQKLALRNVYESFVNT